MSARADSSTGYHGHRLGATALLAVGGATTATLALAVWVLGYAAAQPWGFGPGASATPHTGPNSYYLLAVVWWSAAAAEFLAAAICMRWPRAAAVAVSAAIAVGLVAALAATPTARSLLPASFAALAWLAAATPLVIGVVTLLRGRSSGAQA